MEEFFSKIWETAVNWFIAERGWAAVLASVLVIVLGFIVIKIVMAVVSKIVNRTRMKGLAGDFILTLVKILLFFVYIIAIMNTLGINTSGIVAILTASSLAFSLALQTTLSNFASGMILIGNHPFDVGDVIEVAGVSGVVEKITLFATRLRTGDNKVITIPNSNVAGDNIINYSEQTKRRVDLQFSTAYGTDIERAKAVMFSVVDAHPAVIKEDGYTIRLLAQGASSLDFVCRFWTKTDDYWTAYFDVMEAMTKRFEEEGIEVPFNTIDINVKN